MLSESEESVRLPKSLHRQIDIYSSHEGVSINQFIIYALTEAVRKVEQRSTASP